MQRGQKKTGMPVPFHLFFLFVDGFFVFFNSCKFVCNNRVDRLLFTKEEEKTIDIKRTLE
jgi:hypothetical protein